MKSQIGKQSRSFLREKDYIEVIDVNGELQSLTTLDDKGKLPLSKRKIRDICREELSHKMIFFATYLQNKNKSEIKEVLRDLREHIEESYDDGNFKCIIELHAQDTTVNSFHIHVWSNDENDTIKNIIARYLVLNNITPESSISKVILEKMWGDGEAIPKEGLYINKNSVDDMIKRRQPEHIGKVDDERVKEVTDDQALQMGKDELIKKQEALKEKIENIRKSIKRR